MSRKKCNNLPENCVMMCHGLGSLCCSWVFSKTSATWPCYRLRRSRSGRKTVLPTRVATCHIFVKGLHRWPRFFLPHVHWPGIFTKAWTCHAPSKKTSAGQDALSWTLDHTKTDKYWAYHPTRSSVIITQLQPLTATFVYNQSFAWQNMKKWTNCTFIVLLTSSQKPAQCAKQKNKL